MSNRTPTPPTTDADTEDAKRKAYSKATTRLRKENPDLWNAVLQEEYRKVGIEWTPKPTAAEKAAAQMEELLSQFPELRERVAPVD